MSAPSILLVHPLGYAAASAGADISRKANIMPPLGLASISAYLSGKGIDNHLIDCYAHPDSDQLFADHLRNHKPSHVGFSCTTSSFLDGCRLARRAKELHPEVITVFGGPHVSALAEDIIGRYPEVDLVVVGEGEETLHELLLAKTGDLERVASLVYRDPEGKPVFTGRRRQLLALDSLPFPAYDKLAGYPEAYSLPIFNYPTVPNGSFLSSRGCPYSCSYCDRSVFGRSFRYNSANYLYNHVRHLQQTYGLRHLNIYDDQFTFNRDRVVEFCTMARERQLGVTFNCAARAEHLDLELLKLMKAAGCWMISLGIETGDEQLLAAHRQNPDLKMMREKVALIQQAGIRVKGLLMMGLPGETEKSIKRSRDYVFSLNLDDFNLAKFTPFPGSPIYQQLHEKNSLLGEFDEDWEKMDCMRFQFVPRGMTREQLDKLFIDFYRRHFMRPRVQWQYVTMLWRSPNSWHRFLVNLGSFLRFARSNRRLEGDEEVSTRR